MAFIWTHFGQLKNTRQDDKYLYLINEKNEERKISLSKYAPAIPKIKEKINACKGYPIQIRTSQNTGNWGTDIWFSDISLSDTDVVDTGKDTSDETVDELKRKIKFLEALIEQLEEEYAGLSPVEKKNADKWGEILQEQNIVGDVLHFRCTGHAARTLALRMGIVHEGRIWLKIINQIRRNIFTVELDDFNNRKAIMALGFEDETFFVATVEWPHPKYREACVSMGVNETKIKQDQNYSLEALAKTYLDVDAWLNSK